MPAASSGFAAGHQNIVRHIDAFPHDLGSDMLAVCTVMEFCECGDLAEHRKRLSRWSTSAGLSPALDGGRALRDALVEHVLNHASCTAGTD